MTQMLKKIPRETNICEINYKITRIFRRLVKKNIKKNNRVLNRSIKIKPSLNTKFSKCSNIYKTEKFHGIFFLV